MSAVIQILPLGYNSVQHSIFLYLQWLDIKKAEKQYLEVCLLVTATEIS